MTDKKTRRWLRDYYAGVAALLPCGGREKKTLLRQLRASVEEYLSNAPEATPEELASVFGTPEQIAQSALQTADAGALRKRLSLKKAVLLALLVIVLLYAAFIVVSLIDVHTESHGYFTEGVLRISRMAGGLPL